MTDVTTTGPGLPQTFTRRPFIRRETLASLRRSLDKPARKLAIVGTAPTSFYQAPFQDESWEIWGLNEWGKTQGGRANVWYNLHRAGEIAPEHRAWLAARPEPVVLLEPIEGIPNATLFPFKRLFDTFGFYWASSIDYLIALAILEGYEAIHLYGVDMALDSEYAYQRPSCSFYMGLAAGLGVEIATAEASEILRAPWIYGVEDPPVLAGGLPDREFTDIMENLRRELTQHQSQVDQYKGGLHMTKYWRERTLAQGRLGIPKAPPMPNQVAEILGCDNLVDKPDQT